MNGKVPYIALKVLGSLLFEKRIDEWKSSLYKLKQEPDRNILNILQLSFDGLMDIQKQFLLGIHETIKTYLKYI